ncbi:ATP-grasp domain-containing protein [Cetobacterium sp.]|uniref:ATP-grasp domain-containing protein n=1 Tax=Cetobacterium sp. TaxID=2071632 RepID=UPI003F3973C6
MKKIIIIGANEFQNKLVLKAKEKGLETHVFAWEDGAIAKDNADYFYPISIVEKEKILEEARKIKADGICAIATDLAMPTVNYIAEKLGFVGNSLESTKLTTDKFEMRKALISEDLPCPKFKLVKCIEDVEKEMEYPLIVKPTDRSGSRGVTKVENEIELQKALEIAIEVSFNEKVLVEEFVEGNEYSIEMITQNGKHQFLQLTEKFTTGAPNFIEKGHLSPARNIDVNLYREIIDVIKKSLNCLKIKNGASHSEIKIDSKNNIKIIEIGARMGGDFIGSDMVKISTGIDFTSLVIDVALGEKIPEINNKNYISNALVKFIFNAEDLKNQKKIEKYFSELIVEKNIDVLGNEKITDSSKRKGYYILNIEDNIKLEKILNIL